MVIVAVGVGSRKGINWMNITIGVSYGIEAELREARSATVGFRLVYDQRQVG